jgi:predicted molibdopterin-dependent oxidoreductase YjgC
MFRPLHDPGAEALTIFIDGQPVPAQPGETVAAVMLRQPSPVTRTTPVHGAPRAPYCMMGVCFECLAIVDGVASSQTCMTTVREGMKIERQHGKRSVA